MSILFFFCITLMHGLVKIVMDQNFSFSHSFYIRRKFHSSKKKKKKKGICQKIGGKREEKYKLYTYIIKLEVLKF